MKDSLLNRETAPAPRSVDLAARKRHDHAPEVLSLRWEGKAPGLGHGSITVVCGDERSPLVTCARVAARTGDGDALARVVAGRSYGRPRPQWGSAAVPEAAQPEGMRPIIQVSYYGRPITEGIPLHEALDGVAVVLPFAGGALDAARFEASVYVARGAAAPSVKTLVIVRQPDLSGFERRALDRLTGERALGGRQDVGTTLARLVELRAKLRLAGRLS